MVLLCDARVLSPCFTLTLLAFQRRSTAANSVTRNSEPPGTGGVGFNKLHQTRRSRLGRKQQCEHKTEQLHFHSVKCHHTCSSAGQKTFGQGLNCQENQGERPFPSLKAGEPAINYWKTKYKREDVGACQC